MQTLTFDKAVKLKQFIASEAKAHGFDLFAIANPKSVLDAGDRLNIAVERGYHGDMDWMKETLERRQSPQNLWPEVRSVIMLGVNYGPEHDPRLDANSKDKGNISVYARHRDYHDLIKGRLKQLASRFASRAGGEVKVFVDTAPVMEKPLAVAAGLGWQGKHTNLVSREFGAWLFLGSIFTTLELPVDEAEIDRCGSCKACLNSCPTNAFPAPYQLDARRCISYLTIELKEQIPHEFRKAIGNRIYGCDECLAACPWNKFAQHTNEIKLQARPELMEPDLRFLLGFDDANFRQFFSGSPIKRIGRNRFIRNVLLAAGNSNDRTFIEDIKAHLNDGDVLVRSMAVWALKELMSSNEFDGLRQLHMRQENDDMVKIEWGIMS